MSPQSIQQSDHLPGVGRGALLENVMTILGDKRMSMCLLDDDGDKEGFLGKRTSLGKNLGEGKQNVLRTVLMALGC